MDGSPAQPTPLFSHEISPGAAWSLLVRAGRTVTLTALGPGANATTLLYAASHPVDRLNIPDTLKAQMSACVHPPMVLMSDRGLALASVVASSLDWHDAISGHSTDDDIARFGPTSYADDRNGWRLSARAGLLSELRKHGRDEADLHACVNFFSKVAIGADEIAPLQIAEDHAEEGDFVTLRMEQDVLMIVSTAPHPLARSWAPAGVLVAVAAGEPPAADDPSRMFRSESARALDLAAQVYA